MVIVEKIISKQIIKPSSPTPNKFKNLTLSFVDQISPAFYIPLIFFYQNDESKFKKHAEISQLLKQSLSQILTVFYPLAGTIQENSFIDCNDTGVEFVEARVHAQLVQVMNEPKMEELKQLVPMDSSSYSENAILSVKISFFDCGGIALGVCLSHKSADVASFVTFMNAWAATCRGESQVIQPSFDMVVHFPQRDLSAISYIPGSTTAEETITTKRLVFDREKLEKLRLQAAFGEVKSPTRVEALSAFIWQHFIEASKSKSNTKITSSAAVQSVNLRPRTIPPIPDHTFGNCSVGAFAFLSETEGSSIDLVSNLRAAIRAIDDYYDKQVLCEEYVRTMEKFVGFLKSGAEICSFSSWWRFPVYELDFGWGKPIWVSTTSLPYRNFMILMSTPSGDGIEAWCNMPEDLFQMLETSYNKLFS